MSSHTDRSFHTRERALLTTTRALYGTIDKTVSFLPMALRHGTRTIFSCVRAKEHVHGSTSVQGCQADPATHRHLEIREGGDTLEEKF